MSEFSFPVERSFIEKIIDRMHINIKRASIREVNRLVSLIEEQTSLQFIRMEFGIPGLQTPQLAIDAEIDALVNKQVSHQYAPFDGVPLLKKAAAEFVKAFLDLEVKPVCCIPTNGAMQGGFIAMAIAGRFRQGANKILFIDPGFPVNKLQAAFLGLKTVSLDFYAYRQDRLIARLEELLQQGDVGGVLWSNPNNPTWICLTEQELEGIGRLLTKYDVIGIEDLAYFAMDFRCNYGRPYKAPFQPTVGHYTDNYMILVSSSKIFSYAGQRIAITVISPGLIDRESPDLVPYFSTDRIGHAYIHGGMYITTAGVAESPQYGLAALMEAAYTGRYDFLAPVKVYGERARLMKQAFLDNGFTIVYGNDLGIPLGDGFYFTISYPGFEGWELLYELIRYGVSTISLGTTGSTRTEGLRVCVSLTSAEMIPELKARLQRFQQDHPLS